MFTGHTTAHQRDNKRSLDPRIAHEMGPYQRPERRNGHGSPFECDRCRDEHMIWREKRTIDRIVTVKVYGVEQKEVRSTVIEGAWDICPVCVRRSEVEYGAEGL